MTRTVIRTVAGVAAALWAHQALAAGVPSTTSAAIEQTSSALDPGTAQYDAYNYSVHQSSTSEVAPPGVYTISLGHTEKIITKAVAGVGELHVRSFIQQIPGTVDLPQSGVAGNNNFSATAQAGWQDTFQINSNLVNKGFYTAKININGASNNIVGAQSGGGFGSVTASINFSFSVDDGLGMGGLTTIASFNAFESSYGAPQPPFASVSAAKGPVSSIFGNWSVDVPFVANQTVYLTASARCFTQSGGVTAATSSVWDCDLSHSVYWNGISNIVDGSGQAVADAQIQSQSGFLYAAPSPSLPVPEPETLALMVAGLGLVGAVTRRRRHPLHA